MSAGYYGVQGGSGGGGSSGADQHTIWRTEPGTSSYPTGGFEIDLSNTYSSINSFFLTLQAVGSLVGYLPYYELDTPSAGIVTVKLMKKQYLRVSSIDGATNLPSGVTLLSASGGTTSSEDAHTHPTDHDHGSFTSGVNNTPGAPSNLDALGPNMSSHTHTLDLPELLGTSGAGTSHNHEDNTLYAHKHTLTHTATGITLVELSNGTDISSATFNLLAFGVSA